MLWGEICGGGSFDGGGCGGGGCGVGSFFAVKIVVMEGREVVEVVVVVGWKASSGSCGCGRSGGGSCCGKSC